MSIVPKLPPLKKANASKWNQDNAAYQRLASAKKAAAKLEKPKESWWAKPHISRQEFYAKAADRHREILNGASDSSRSLHRVI